MARLAAVQCFYACDGNLAAAVRRFKETWNAEVCKGSPNFIRAPREFIQRHVDKLAPCRQRAAMQAHTKPRHGVAMQQSHAVTNGFFYGLCCVR